MTATRAQHTATVIGWVDGEAVPRVLLDARISALRTGPGAAALPAPDCREGRQLVRWTAHVLFTELLCAGEARGLGLNVGSPAELDVLGAVQLGSVNSAAWRSEPAVSAVFRAVVDEPDPTPAPARTARQWRLRVASAPSEADALAIEPVSIGWTTLTDLPTALADAARSARPGERVGPLPSGGRWHVVVVDTIDAVPVSEPTPARHSGPALRAFARWLDLRRARSVRAAEGFEHPGDPRQPDNTHQH